MLTTSSVFALDYTPQASSSAKSEDFMCYSDGEGRTLTNIDGEVFQVIDVSKERTIPVTDATVIAQLNKNMMNAQAGYPLFDIKNAVDAPWSGTIDLSRGEYASPVINRYDNRVTHLQVNKNGHYWFNYYFHDYTTDQWTLLGITDVTFNVIFKDWSYNHSGYPGNSIDYCQLVFISAYSDNALTKPISSFTAKIGVTSGF